MTLPDCMMPDGAEPCKGYAELRAEIERLRASIRYALLRSPWDSEPTKVQTLEKLRNALNVPDQEHIVQKPGQKPGLLPNGNIAAEVGKTYVCALQTGKSGRRCIGWDNAIKRCAQVADGYIQITPCEKTFTAKAIAAEIRALKDKP